MNVLSLFDGISCAYIGLQRAGIDVSKYYASEIDKYAIRVSQNRVPCRIDVGDVRTITALDDTIDLLVGGSPCQDMSIAKKGRMGLAGQRSSLFWEYVRIKELIKPKYFLLENVASMPKADKETITKTLGVEPIMINASLVSAQSRKRLFWTNIPNVIQPEDRGIMLKDILQPDAEVDDRMVVKGKAHCLTATYAHANTTEAGVRNSVERKQRTLVKSGAAIRGRQDANGNWIQTVEVRDDEKSNALTHSHMGKMCLVSEMTLLPKPKEHEFTQIGYFGDKNASGVGGQALRVYTAEGKSTTSGVGLYDTGRIRKLTPIECERLQGLPDNYTEGISMTQRYKCLGNAFNVDVVAHIFKSILV